MDRKRRIRRFLEDARTEVAVAILIVISVALLFIEVGVSNGSPIHSKLVFANDLLTMVFVVELFVRFYAEPRKEKFFRKCWYDILAVLPALRILRFFRILRLLRLYRLGLFTIRRLQRVSNIFKLVRAEYVMIGLGLFTATMMGALSMRVTEGKFNADFATMEQTLWYAVMTIIAGEPTGGAPTSPAGQAITLTLMVIGLTLFAVITGTVSAVMIDMLKTIRISRMEPDDLNNHVIVCGWNPAGAVILAELLRDRDRKQYVIISEAETPLLDDIIKENSDTILTMVGDYTRVDFLRQAHIERADTAILLADATIPSRSAQDQDARTVLAAMLIESINDDIYTIVQLNNRDNETSLRRMGVEEIIVSEEYVGNLVATMTRNWGIVTMINELLTAEYGEQFYRSKVPDELVGMEVADAISRLKLDYDAVLLAVDLQNGTVGRDGVLVNPPSDFRLEAQYYLFVAASKPLG